VRGDGFLKHMVRRLARTVTLSRSIWETLSGVL
jgi:tRNA U38,U39,U40 pseudouridine synthase TruA